MSYRPGFRTASGGFAGFRTAFRRTFNRRWQSSTTAEQPVKENSNPFSWNSPVGPKTVHFWAPVMKWALVGVSISDFGRPAEQLSLPQSFALTATGAIWTRWCLIIKPKNYLLAAVNFFLFLANGYQIARIVNYNMDQKNKTLSGEVKSEAKAAEAKVENVVEEAKSAIKSATSK